jgi:hypothetical protein
LEEKKIPLITDWEQKIKVWSLLARGQTVQAIIRYFDLHVGLDGFPNHSPDKATIGKIRKELSKLSEDILSTLPVEIGRFAKSLVKEFPPAEDWMFDLLVDYQKGATLTKETKWRLPSLQLWNGKLLPSQKEKWLQFVEWQGKYSRVDFLSLLERTSPPSGINKPLVLKRKNENKFQQDDAIKNDKGLFKQIDDILTESDFKRIFMYMRYSSLLESDSYRIFEYFRVLKSLLNRWCNWKLKYNNRVLLEALEKIIPYLEEYLTESDIIQHFFHDNFEIPKVHNTYSQVLEQLLKDASFLDIPAKNELYIIFSHDLDRWLDTPEFSEHFDSPKYLEWLQEYTISVANLENIYNTFRSSISESLYI